MAANIRFLKPETLIKPPSYSQVVEVRGPGRTVYVAGQLGLDLDNKLVGAPGDFSAQCTQAFENLRLALAAVGADFDDVVRVNNYLTDIGHIATLREVRSKYLNLAAPPASTTIAISSLARPDALFEVDAIAVLPAKTARKRIANRQTRRAKGTRR